MQKHYRNLFLVCTLVAAVSFALGLGARKYGGHRYAARPLWLASLTGRGMSNSPERTFAAVLDNLEESYVDKIADKDEKTLTYGALRQMMDELDDPNSRFLDPAETRDVLDAEDGVFHGIGAIVTIQVTRSAMGEHRRCAVVNVLPDGPAAKAGLRAGDVIVGIDGQWLYMPRPGLPAARRAGKAPVPSPTLTADGGVVYSTNDIMRSLSQDGKVVRLALMGADGKALEQVDVTTSATRVRPVEMQNRGDGVAEIRIAGFTKTIGPELDSALARVAESGARKLVLDLRGCVGGSLERATQVASRFVDGALGSVARKPGSKARKEMLVAHRTSNAWTGPLVVMVDRGTLSAAEFVAGSLSAKKRATIVGTRTFGDGLEHSVVMLHDGSSLVMTTGKIFMMNGQSYHARGVTPAVAVASAADQMPAAIKSFR